MLRREFVYAELDPEKAAQREMNEALDYLLEKRFAEELDGRIVLSREGEEAARLLVSLIAPFLESYFLTFRTVQRFDKSPVAEKDIQRRAAKTADRLFSTGEISRKESKNILIFETALGYLQEEGIVHGDVKALKRGKKFERTYTLADPDALTEQLGRLQPFLLALR
jgi:glycerol-3-phosphate O-acyltransferase